MKHSILTIVMALTTMLAVSQNNNFETAMQNVKAQYDTSKTVDQFLEIANKFERIAIAEKDKWLPYYYACFSYVNITFTETNNETKDKYLDKAQELADKAIAVAPNESELYIMQAVVLSLRIGINPMTRGAQIAPKLYTNYAKATELNPENPRIYYLQANQAFHTPANFGGGPDKALPLFQLASEKFEKFVPKSDLHPNWGKEDNQKMLTACLEAKKD